MRNARNARKALLIVSDGGDNHQPDEPLAGEVGDARIRPADVRDRHLRRRHRKLSPEEVNGPGLLRELAGKTGDRHYRLDNLDEMASVANRISSDMRNEYLLGFTPAGAQSDSKYDRIKITANPTDGTKVNVFYRRRYYAPTQ